MKGSRNNFAKASRYNYGNTQKQSHFRKRCCLPFFVRNKMIDITLISIYNYLNYHVVVMDQTWLWPTDYWGHPLVSRTSALADDPLSSVGCEVGPPWIALLPANPMDARLDWEIDTLRARSTSWALCHAPWPIPEQFLQCDRELCPSERATAISECYCHGECTWSATISEWLLHFLQLHPHQWEEPRFSSRTLDCNEMIIVIHFTCQWL